ncbi:hypothetical protein BH11BAC4_BH11BAC4_02770 [soil metagenome]
MRLKKLSTSFFICIAVVYDETKVKTKKLQAVINTVKHIKNIQLVEFKQIEQKYSFIGSRCVALQAEKTIV